MIYCSLNQVEHQLPQSPRIARALQWLQQAVAGKDDTLQLLSSLEPGSSKRVEIEGDAIFANLMCYETTPECEKLESHRKYCDIQYVHRGTEGLAWADLDELDVLDPYDPVRDLAFYHVNDRVIELALPAGKVACLLPSDGHGLGFTAGHHDRRERVEKIVIKVAL